MKRFLQSPGANDTPPLVQKCLLGISGSALATDTSPLHTKGAGSSLGHRPSVRDETPELQGLDVATICALTLEAVISCVLPFDPREEVSVHCGRVEDIAEKMSGWDSALTLVGELLGGEPAWRKPFICASKIGCAFSLFDACCTCCCVVHAWG